MQTKKRKQIDNSYIYNKKIIMGLFDYFKDNKNILTENGVNYIYYNGNGRLKEKFTMINGVLHGEYFKYDASGSIYSIKVFNNGIDVNTGKE